MAPLASGHISFVVYNSPKHVGYFELQTPFTVLPITHDYLEYITLNIGKNIRNGRNIRQTATLLLIADINECKINK